LLPRRLQIKLGECVVASCLPSCLTTIETVKLGALEQMHCKQLHH
jgi:hypothetical protein